MPKVCICQICVCGRHHCPRKHTRETIPKDAEDSGNFQSEMKRSYAYKGRQARQAPRKPEHNLGLPSGSMINASTTMQDYTPKKLPPRFVRQKTKYTPPESTMYGKSTYRTDYCPGRDMPPREKPKRHSQNLIIPSDKMECRTTQNRDYVAWERKAAEACRAKPIVPVGTDLMARGQEFRGQSETMRSYRRPPAMPRVTGHKKPDHLFTEGKFEGKATTSIDYPLRKLEPRTSFKPKRGSKLWPDADIKSYTTYKTDYKPPDRLSRTQPCGPKETQIKPADAPFVGHSCYKTDYPAHLTQLRKDPPWHLKRTYTKPDTPFSGSTTYRKDFLCPPEDLVPEKGKPHRCNLTVGGDPMATVTTHRVDYPYPEGFRPVVSTKPKETFMQPSTPFASETTTRHDYPHKCGAPAKPVRYAGNLGTSDNPMDLVTMTRKDYQCQRFDCPAARLKMGDEEVLSQYKFVDSNSGHEYYQKLKPKKGNSK